MSHDHLLSFQVVWPDGRKQIVTYKVADQHSGYIADVRYEGEPTYVAPAPYSPPAPYVAPYVAPTPAPYVAPLPTPAPYVAPVITPAPYVAPVQPFNYAQAYKPYAPVQPYQVPTIRKYNFTPVEPAASVVPVAPAAPVAVAPAVPVAVAAVPIAPSVPAVPVEAVPVEAPVSVEERKVEEGIEVENPVPVIDNYAGEWKQIYYSDANHLKPQRQEKIHTGDYY